MILKNFIDDCLLWRDHRAIAKFKQQPSNFIVDEILNWDFRGQGEHLFLRIEKTNCNTVWVAKQLAKFYEVPPRDVGYSGLKDRHAVTTQYFSIRLPGIKPDAYELPTHDEYRVVEHHLHDKKLKRGNHKYNDFSIRLLEVSGNTTNIDKRLQGIRDNGCPNFFDSQRFGNDNSNLTRLQQWINGEIDIRKRIEKSLLLSALRAAVFNQELSERVQDSTWDTVIANDVVILDGSHSHFVAEHVDETLTARAAAKDIHPAGRLIGEDSQQVADNANLLTLMRREHLSEGYRPLRVNVQNLTWQWSSDTLTVNMRLPSGTYASGVIRHIADFIA